MLAVKNSIFNSLIADLQRSIVLTSECLQIENPLVFCSLLQNIFSTQQNVIVCYTINSEKVILSEVLPALSIGYSLRSVFK